MLLLYTENNKMLVMTGMFYLRNVFNKWRICQKKKNILLSALHSSWCSSCRQDAVYLLCRLSIIVVISARKGARVAESV